MRFNTSSRRFSSGSSRLTNGSLDLFGMQNPWDVRPRQTRGDDDPVIIFCSVGAALSAWEHLESQLGELFDCLVCGSGAKSQSNRAGFTAFSAVNSSSARTQLIHAAVPRALAGSPHLTRAETFIAEVSDFGARRNEIAHGLVHGLGEFGFYLCPNNTNPNKWHLKGERKGGAKFQYVASDVAHYMDCFTDLISRCQNLVDDIYKERCLKNKADGA